MYLTISGRARRAGNIEMSSLEIAGTENEYYGLSAFRRKRIRSWACFQIVPMKSRVICQKSHIHDTDTQRGLSDIESNNQKKIYFPTVERCYWRRSLEFARSITVSPVSSGCHVAAITQASASDRRSIEISLDKSSVDGSSMPGMISARRIPPKRLAVPPSCSDLLDLVSRSALARAALQLGARRFIYAGMEQEKIARAVEVAANGERPLRQRVSFRSSPRLQFVPENCGGLGVPRW